MNYEVTIGIPVYKAVDYIENTMKSALNQTFDSIEYLVVDDCGNDDSMDKVRDFAAKDERIKVIYNEVER